MKFNHIAMGGAFLIALSTFQGEFDYAVPQFRLDWHPILLMMAAGIGLVTARIVDRQGGALGAALFFILIRGLLSLWVGPLTGHTTLHFPLYLAEALVVEAVAMRVPREQPIRLGIYRRHRHRHDRPGRRVGLVVRLVGAAVDRVDAARGGDHRRSSWRSPAA